MKLKHLESALSSVSREFPSPNILLEQYPTSSELTAAVVFSALQNGDVGPGLTALDLGCGTGMLAIGCALVECHQVFAVDCDADALNVAKQNVHDLELDDSISLVLGKVRYAASPKQDNRQKGAGRRSGRVKRGGRSTSNRSTPRHQADTSSSLILTKDDGIPFRDDCVDTVLTNPPFGTKHNAGIDIQFLRTATRLARKAVYSFHKTSTRDYLLRKVSEWGMEATIVAEMKFELPNTYKFHKSKSVDIEVDLLRVLIPEQRSEDDKSNDMVDL